MKRSITQGIPKERVEEVKADFICSAGFRLRLIDILNRKKNAKRSKATLEVTYENPNWAYVQADLIGYERAINDVIFILSDDVVEKDT